jgi:hypothetical protein
MKQLTAIIGLALIVLAACSRSKPITHAEVVGEWQPIMRWGKGPMTGSINFRTDGTCETIKLPWGSITGDEPDLVSLESVAGKWEFEVVDGKQAVCVRLETAKSTGKSIMIWINPELRSGEWTFRQYIGDPDLMDIVEFKKRAASPPTEKR